MRQASLCNANTIIQLWRFKENVMHNVEVHAVLNVIAVYVFTIVACLFGMLGFCHPYFLAGLIFSIYLVVVSKTTANTFLKTTTRYPSYQRTLRLNQTALVLTLLIDTGLSIWFIKETEFAKADVLFFILFVVIPSILLLMLLSANIKSLKQN
jgi:ABC-type proline/glycine betaine transport system permease subunit